MKPGGLQHRLYVARWRVAFVVALTAFFVSSDAQFAHAQAPARWGMDQFPVRDVRPGAAATFRDLLQSEISQLNGVAFVDLGVACPDSACTIEAARRVGVRYAVHASLGALGQKIVVSFVAVDASLGKVLVSDSMTAMGVDELDTLARRIAATLVGGEPVEQTVQLGQVTQQDEQAPRRRDTRVAFVLGPEAIVPLRGYADRQLGVGMGLGAWFETYDFAIEPRISYRSELGTGRALYDHVAFDMGVYYLLSRTDVSPLLGAGLGLHYLHEEVEVENRVGRELVSSTRDLIDDSVMGFGGFLRAGVLVLRTYDISALIALDYALTLAQFQERDDEQALRLSFTLIMGGT